MSDTASDFEYNWVHPAVLDNLRDDGRLANLDDTPIVSSFTAAYDQLSTATKTVVVPKDCVDDPEEYGFEPARFTFGWRARQTYRDQFSEKSVELQEYQRYYVARVNQYNPERGRLIEHALTDKLPYTVGAGVAAFAAYEYLRGRQADD